MKKIGRPKKHDEKEKPEYDGVSIGGPVEKTAPIVNICPSDRYYYHREFEPRVFKQGEVLPEGWTVSRGILGVIWQQRENGSWEKIT